MTASVPPGGHSSPAHAMRHSSELLEPENPLPTILIRLRLINLIPMRDGERVSVYGTVGNAQRMSAGPVSLYRTRSKAPESAAVKIHITLSSGSIRYATVMTSTLSGLAIHPRPSDFTPCRLAQLITPDDLLTFRARL